MNDKPYTLKKVGNSGEFDYIDQDGISHRSPSDWLWTGILEGCGCGSSDDLANRAVQVLDIFASTDNWDYRCQFFNDPANEILAHWLDSVGLLEHGTIFTGSWLTESGKQIHTQIREFDFSETS